MALTIQDNHNILLSLAEGKPRTLQAARQLTSDELEQAVNHLLEVLQEVEEQEKLNAEQNAERIAKANEIVAALEKAGLSLSDLSEVTSVQKVKAKVEAKYCIEVQGETHEWTGRGKMPKVFAQYMEERDLTKDQLPLASN